MVFTAREVADQVRRELASGDERMALRLLLDGVTRLATELRREPAETTRLLVAPRSVGDERWDALLGGAVAHVCRRTGTPIPHWTRHKTLTTWWWPGGPVSSRAKVMVRTPMELERLGIWLDEKELRFA